MGSDTCVECVRLRAINAKLLSVCKAIRAEADDTFIDPSDMSEEWIHLTELLHEAITDAESPPPVSGGSPDDPMEMPRGMSPAELRRASDEAWAYYVGEYYREENRP